MVQNNVMDLAANKGHFFSPVYELPGMFLRIKPWFNELSNVEVWFAQNLILSIQLPLLEWIPFPK